MDPWEYMDHEIKVADLTYLFTEVSKTVVAVKLLGGRKLIYTSQNGFPRSFQSVAVCQSLSYFLMT